MFLGSLCLVLLSVLSVWQVWMGPSNCCWVLRPPPLPSMKHASICQMVWQTHIYIPSSAAQLKTTSSEKCNATQHPTGPSGLRLLNSVTVGTEVTTPGEKMLSVVSCCVLFHPINIIPRCNVEPEILTDGDQKLQQKKAQKPCQNAICRVSTFHLNSASFTNRHKNRSKS